MSTIFIIYTAYTNRPVISIHLDVIYETCRFLHLKTKRIIQKLQIL
ncbi:hypothetical protein ANACOL_00086 [Anaerotruncus colihominis DSM 17241]|uniref:Uncharacterized protein n=1 Tax=Anaerotruncus colihominis DSM 17241 TaxID=445972 RepID=B0P5R4_9FIRM|nr:hypothetical protein ANACOL_00086 [Anaerotruncus colihominis DSM 17241]